MIEFENGKALHGDCLELMQDLEDKSIDLILCDLPYNITACKWDVVIPFNLLWEQYERVIKDGGAIVLTASQPFTSALVMSNTKLFKYEWIWNKITQSNPFIAKYRCMSIHENILVFGKGKINYYPQKFYNGVVRTGKRKNGGRLGELFINSGEDYNRNQDGFAYPKSIIEIKRSGLDGSNEQRKLQSLHPTQKPVALFEYLIKTYTNEGETVLDNCAGSFTTAIACINTNRKFVCIEKDETYFTKGIDRINQHGEHLLMAA